jgi:hypothetical protein
VEKLLAFCTALDERAAPYDLKVVRGNAVMATVVVPGEYLEIEFFLDGTVELERFVSQGVEAAADAELDQVIEAWSG